MNIEQNLEFLENKFLFKKQNKERISLSFPSINHKIVTDVISLFPALDFKIHDKENVIFVSQPISKIYSRVFYDYITIFKEQYDEDNKSVYSTLNFKDFYYNAHNSQMAVAILNDNDFISQLDEIKKFSLVSEQKNEIELNNQISNPQILDDMVRIISDNLKIYYNEDLIIENNNCPHNIVGFHPSGEIFKDIVKIITTLLSEVLKNYVGKNQLPIEVLKYFPQYAIESKYDLLPIYYVIINYLSLHYEMCGNFFEDINFSEENLQKFEISHFNDDNFQYLNQGDFDLLNYNSITIDLIEHAKSLPHSLVLFTCSLIDKIYYILFEHYNAVNSMKILNQALEENLILDEFKNKTPIDNNDFQISNLISLFSISEESKSMLLSQLRNLNHNLENDTDND